MRTTLEQLKAMSEQQLVDHWLRGKFPFDGVSGCGNCMTIHAKCDTGGCHKELAEMVRPLKGTSESVRRCLVEHLEELYAIRLFHDSLYPQTESSEMIVESVADVAPVQP